MNELLHWMSLIKHPNSPENKGNQFQTVKPSAIFGALFRRRFPRTSFIYFARRRVCNLIGRLVLIAEGNLPPPRPSGRSLVDPHSWYAGNWRPIGCTNDNNARVKLARRLLELCQLRSPPTVDILFLREIDLSGAHYKLIAWQKNDDDNEFQDAK